MSTWPNQPLIYEINTWVWLTELSRQYGYAMTLDTVPAAEWDAMADLGFDALWLMGVWERSPAGIRIALNNKRLVESFRRALPDFSEADNVGSPYCVRRYQVDQRLGGPTGLAIARQRLAQRGIRLILDFVPNHLAPDHPWVTEHPEFFIQGSLTDLQEKPEAFVAIDGRIFACGRDPYFPAWPDVLQLDAFNPALRNATVATLTAIAGQCDGVRCDMAMLLINSIFERTWGLRAGPVPQADYWPFLITAVKQLYPAFKLIAEAYWGLERALQQQGFDYCYDKSLYDWLGQNDAEKLREHLTAAIDYQQRLVRFIENHDEPRAAAVFSAAQARAYAVIFATLPGAKLFHQGQFEGLTVRLPIFLARMPPQPSDPMLGAFYRKLLNALQAPVFQEGRWQLCDCHGWPDNLSARNLIAWCWQTAEQQYLIVVNVSNASAQGRVRLRWPLLADGFWQLTDLFTDTVYLRQASEMLDPGLYVSLAAWAFHVLRFSKPAERDANAR